MKPTLLLDEGRIRLYQGDCFDILPTIPPGKIDAVVTDPPYGVNYADWDDDIPPLGWLEESRRITNLVMFTPGNGSQYKYPPPPDWTLCWARPGSVQRAANGGFSHWEPILVYGKNPMDVDCKIFQPNTKSKHFNHPCPKPVPVMLWLVSACGNRILDPFMGSGTTCVACIRSGRSFVGIEKDPEHFEVAANRIKAELIRRDASMRAVMPPTASFGFSK